MRLALFEGKRTLAEKGRSGICPLCGVPVVARCGEININHWAHESLNDCEGGEESEWHLGWKELFPIDCTEIIEENHRADVIYEGTVYEFQTKPMDPREMNARGQFWKERGYKFVWVLNTIGSRENFNFKIHPTFVTFRWKMAKRRLELVTDKVILDFGENKMLELRRVHWGAPVGGWGIVTSPKKLFPKL